MKRAQFNTTTALILLLVIMIVATMVFYRVLYIQKTSATNAVCNVDITKSFIGHTESTVADFFKESTYRLACEAPVHYIDTKSVGGITSTQKATAIAQGLATEEQFAQTEFVKEFNVGKIVAQDIQRCWEMIGDKPVFDANFKIPTKYTDGKKGTDTWENIKSFGGTSPPTFCIVCGKLIFEPNTIVSDSIDITELLKKSQTKAKTSLYSEIQKGILKTIPDYIINTKTPQLIVYYRQYPFAPDEQGVRETEGYGYSIYDASEVQTKCDLLANSYGDIS